MSVLSVIAFVFGALGVWLTIRQTIWCWPVALVAVIASVFEFYNERLYGDMPCRSFIFLPVSTVGSIGKNTAGRIL